MADLHDRGAPGTPTPPSAGAWSAPPGWYADPDEGGGRRYWDGGAWTERRPGLGNVLGSILMGAVAAFFSVLFLGTILTEDCERDGMQYVCRSANLETTINIPILVVVVPVSVVALLGGIVGLISWFAATRQHEHPPRLVHWRSGRPRQRPRRRRRALRRRRLHLRPQLVLQPKMAGLLRSLRPRPRRSSGRTRRWGSGCSNG